MYKSPKIVCSFAYFQLYFHRYLKKSHSPMHRTKTTINLLFDVFLSSFFLRALFFPFFGMFSFVPFLNAALTNNCHGVVFACWIRHRR